MKGNKFVVGHGLIETEGRPHFAVNILGYRSEHAREGWIAHALEVNLTASGETFEQALELLMESITFHVTASIRKFKNEALIYNPAPPRYWEMFTRLREMSWRRMTPNPDPRYRTETVPIPAPHVIAKQRKAAFANV